MIGCTLVVEIEFVWPNCLLCVCVWFGCLHTEEKNDDFFIGERTPIENQYWKDIWFCWVVLWLSLFFLLYYFIYYASFSTVWDSKEFTLFSQFVFAALFEGKGCWLEAIVCYSFYFFFGDRLFIIFFSSFIYLFCCFLFQFVLLLLPDSIRSNYYIKHFTRICLYRYGNLDVQFCIVIVNYMRKQKIKFIVLCKVFCLFFFFAFSFCEEAKVRKNKRKKKLKQQLYWLVVLYGDGLIDWFITSLRCME